MHLQMNIGTIKHTVTCFASMKFIQVLLSTSFKYQQWETARVMSSKIKQLFSRVENCSFNKDRKLCRDKKEQNFLASKARWNLIIHSGNHIYLDMKSSHSFSFLPSSVLLIMNSFVTKKTFSSKEV